MKTRILTFLLAIQFLFAYSQKVEGIISKIIDGDSFELISNGQKFQARLNGIDCPEYDQPIGQEATNFVTKYLNKNIEYVSFGLDEYKRVLVDIFIDGVAINSLLVVNGLAWHYKQYSSDQELANKENHAKAKKIGVWSQENPIAPWDWRKQIKTNNISFSDSTQTTVPQYNNFTATNSQEISEDKVIICGGKSSTKYHKNASCLGLENCKGGLYEITKPDAQSKGLTACSICY